MTFAFDQIVSCLSQKSNPFDMFAVIFVIYLLSLSFTPFCLYIRDASSSLTRPMPCLQNAFLLSFLDQSVITCFPFIFSF